MTANSDNKIAACVASAPKADKAFPVQKRGRPESDPRETAHRILRRRHFGGLLRQLREGVSLNLSQAATQSGMTSPRKLSQYETTCYPPGEAIQALAPLYGVSDQELAELCLSHSDPALYEALTGKPGYEPSENDIAAYLAAKPKPKN